MGRAGLNRKTALATLTLTLAAEAPDLDVLGGLRGRAFAFAHHRGFTHSFLGVPIDALVVVGCVYLFWRLRGRKTSDPNLPVRWGWLYFFACLAGLSHILLDLVTTFGTMIWSPIRWSRTAWDLIFIIDFTFTAILLVPQLLNRGYKEEDILKILGSNLLRAFRAAERTAAGK